MVASENGYISALTGLRGVAAWWVVVYHFSDPLVGIVPAWLFLILRHGYLSVDLFFVLSGCVIYASSGRFLGSLGRRVVVTFLLNRLIRIYPLHLVLMLLYLANPLALWIFSSGGGDSARYGAGYYIASIFLVQNWGGFDRLQWNIPAWSISAEFAAYLLCPFLIYISVSKLVDSIGRLALMAFILAMSLGTVFFYREQYSLGDNITSLGVIRCVLEFWIGLCVGAICQHKTQVTTKRLWLNSVALVVLAAIVVSLFFSGVSDFWVMPLWSALLILILSKGDHVFSRFLSIGVIHYIGVISYSTYLTHFFIKDWVKFLSVSVGVTQFSVYIAVCLISSIVFYEFVEKPSRVHLRRYLLRVM